jgi:hypothetical protein
MKRLLTVLAALVAFAPRAAVAQTYTLAPTAIQQFFDNGVPASGYKLCTYVTGTSTAASTYLNTTGTANTNPIILSSNGRPLNGSVEVPIFLTAGTTYKFVLMTPGSDTTCSTGTTVWSEDPVPSVPGAGANVDLQETAGTTITINQCVYLSDGSGALQSGRWYPCDSTNTYSSTLPEIGIAQTAATAGQTFTVRHSGSVTGLTALSPGAEYFVSTAGNITASAPSNKRHVGHADSTTSLVLSGNPEGLATPISVASGGTGLASTPTNGQLLIGNGSGYTLATVTAGAGIAVTNGVGTVTVATTTPWTLLKANSGTDSNTVATTVDTIAISGLTQKDSLVVYLVLEEATQALPTGANLVSTTDSNGTVCRVTDAINAADATFGHCEIFNGASTTNYYGLGNTYDIAGGSKYFGVKFAATTAWTGSWTLGLRHAGVTAGGTLSWRWEVYKVAGQ